MALAVSSVNGKFDRRCSQSYGIYSKAIFFVCYNEVGTFLDTHGMTLKKQDRRFYDSIIYRHLLKGEFYLTLHYSECRF